MDMESEAKRTGKLNWKSQQQEELSSSTIQHFKREAPNIHELDLRINALKELPSDVSQLKNVRTVRLNYNHFTKLPRVLASLPRLTTLDMGGNRVQAIDSSIARLNNLQLLDLSGNMLTEVDSSISKLTSLTRLVLENNELQTLPESIGDMPNLQKLDVSSNSLEKLPESLGQSRSLRELDAKHNKLRSLPPTLGHVKTLQRLELDGNPLEQTVAQNVDAGIVQLLKFLREEEERRKQEELERLKPVGHPAGSWLEYSIKFSLHDSSEDDARCSCRQGSSIAVASGRIIIFGGTVNGSHTADTFYVNLDRLQWLRPAPSQSHIATHRPPAPREGHVAAFDENNRRMVVFGGRSQGKRVNDMFALDMTTLVWSRVEQDGTKPEPREYAASVVWGRIWVIFGGRGSKGRLNDVHFFDMDSNAWSRPFIEGEAPAPRQAPAAALRGDSMYILGGRNGVFTFDDLFKLDLENKMWEHIETTGVSPGRCYSHCLTVLENELWVFGGYDCDGNERTRLHRLSLAKAGSAYTDSEGNVGLLRASWMEYESELYPNENRLAIFRGNILTVFQRGSQSDATVEAKETEADKLWYWDCFKTVEVTRLQEKALSEEVLHPPNAKRQRVHQILSEQINRMPRNARLQSSNEQAVIKYLERFRLNFIELYPHRNSLMLYPPNECNVRKPLCATLRPTELPYPELYQEDGIASFVSNFIKYEELEGPVSYPETVPSPWSVLQWQAGDCFDMAILLCSLLLGVGYDAYVVSGYAPKLVTCNDQSNESCPYFEAEERLKAYVEGEKESEEQRLLRTTKYTTRRKRAHEEEEEETEPGAHDDQQQEEQSQQAHAYAEQGPGDPEQHGTVDVNGREEQQQLLQMRRAKHTQQGEIKMGEAENQGAIDESKDLPEDKVKRNLAAEKAPSKDVFGGHRKHAWVCVLPGRRGVSRAHYIEPTTARKYDIAQSPYEGVEFIFNRHNIWVNMQEDSIRRGRGKMLPELTFELENFDLWEPVLPSGDDAFIGTGLSWKEESSKLATTASAQERPRTSSRSASTKASGQSSGSTASGHPTSASTQQSGDHSDEGDVSGYQRSPGPTDLIVEMPSTWVPRLELSRKQLDARCPGGSKEIIYYKSKHQLYATFGEHARWDGLIERVMTFEDEARSKLTRSIEHFARRQDKLSRREKLPQENKVIEQFSSGSSYSVKEVTTVHGMRRFVTFYAASRTDKLQSREEIYFTHQTGDARSQSSTSLTDGLECMMECFKDRDDLLQKRKVRYIGRSHAAQRAAAQGRRRRRDDASQPIRDVVEQYVLDRSSEASEPEEQVAVKAFLLAKDTIKIQNHYGQGRITAPVRVFTKDGKREVYGLREFEPRPSTYELEEHYNRLVAAEQDVVSSIRESEGEAYAMQRTRQNEEFNVSLQTPYYDITRADGESAEDSQEETGTSEKQKSKSWYDFLAPFLPEDAKDRELTASEAEKVRDQARQALTNRLAERANIIQTRYNEEAERYHKKQQNFQRDRDQQTQEQEEKHERECEEILFRMHVLRQRLDKHEKEAHERHDQLMRKLAEDPRLKALHSPR